MKISRLVISAVSLLALMSGCDTVDTFDWNSKYYGTPDQVYAMTFNTLFPKIKESSTWSTLQTDSIRVTALSPEATMGVQVFTAEPCGSRSDCFMLYEGTVNTGRSAGLVFDVPMGLSYVYVAFVQKDGARTIFPMSVGGVRSMRVNPAQTYTAAGMSLVEPSTSSYYPFASSYYTHSYTTYSEFRSNFNRSNGLCTSFEYMSLGNDVYLIPFGNSDETDRTLYYYAYNPTGITTDDVKAAISAGTISGTRLYASSDQVVWSVNSTSEPYRTKPYILRGIPSGYRVLFYTVSNSGKILTSNANYNSNSVPAAGVMEVNGHTIVRFDEAGSNASVNGTRTNGYDDLAFGLYGGAVLDFENDPSSYKEYGVTYAFEAPLTTAETDCDFNDAIVRVHHVVGRNKLLIIPVAVGEKGCELHVDFKETVILPELHQLLGTDTTATVNTESITVTKFDTTTIEVPADYLLTNNLHDIRFGVKVGTTAERYYSLPTATGTTTNVFVLASPRWNWSLEGTSIATPYPSVVRWAAVPTAYSNWYTTTWTTITDRINNGSFIAGDSQIN